MKYLPALLLALLASLLFLFIGADDALGHNKWNGGYRKWPWKADEVRSITTLPNTPPHSGQSNQLAIDVGMSYETVYSISPGTYIEFVDRYCFGKTLVIQDNDGSHIAYAHLDWASEVAGGRIAGQPIATSGNTTGGGGTSCSSGAHLHFARYSARPSFTMSDRNIQASLEPISGHGQPIDTLEATGYTSDNAGISYDSTGMVDISMVIAYVNVLGGYNGWGITAKIGGAWSPCRATLYPNTWWRYTCNPASWANGSVQTYKGPNERQRAIMRESGLGSYGLHRGILGAYTEIISGQDWVYWIGYPTGNRYYESLCGCYIQNFRYGQIAYYPATCEEKMYQYGNYIRSYSFCD